MAEIDVGVLPVAENDQSMIRVGDVNLARHYVADLHSRFSFQICRRLPPVKTRFRDTGSRLLEARDRAHPPT
jgi:hypothetical protein